MTISKGRALSATVNSATSLIKSSIDGTVTTATIEQSAQQYANADALPSIGNTFGEMALVQSTNRMYVWNGSGWYNVALINTNPTFTTSPAGSYTLDGDSPRSNITITVAASDPESLGVSFSFETGGQFDSMADVTQDSSVFTLVPKTNASLIDGTTYTGTLTIKATDGVNIVPAVSSITLDFVTFISHSNKTELLLKATGTGDNTTPTDASASSHSLVMNGATASLGTFSPYKATGYSMYFDGSGDYLTAPTSDDFTMTGAFTVEMWVYLDQTSYARTVQRLITPANSSPTSEPYISIGNDQGGVNAGCLCFTSSVAAGNPQGYATVEGTGATGTNLYFPFKQWVHIALTRDGSNVCRLFQDGVIVATVTISGGFDFNGANNGGISIAKSGWNTAEYFGPGYITDLRMVNGTAVYTANFTPPEERLTVVTNTKLLLGAPGFYDKSAGRHVISVNGNTYIDSLAPYNIKSFSISEHGGSAHFPGTADEIKTSDGSSNEVVLGSGDFTVELWLYKHTAVSSFWEAILSQMYTASGGWRLYKTDASGNLNWYEATTNRLTPTIPIKQKEWTHIVFERMSGTLYCWINGKAAGNVSSTYNYTGGTNGEIEIGKGTYASSLPIDCHITDVRIVVGTAVYTGDFTPPSGPLTTTGGTYPSTTNVNTSITAAHTKLLLNMIQGSVRDESQITHSVKMVGDTVASATQHFSQNTIEFPGSSDYIKTDQQPFAAGEIFTIEGWHYLDARTNSSPAIFSNYNSHTTGSLALFAGHSSSTTTQYQLSQNGVFPAFNAGTVAYNAWVHFAVQRNLHNNIQVYIGGTQVGSDLASAMALAGVGNDFYIGTSGDTIAAASIDGRLHDFRITKGLTRYPFVPLKQTLTATNSQRDGVTVTASNVTLLTCHAATITDGSSNSTSITTNGNAAVSSFGPAPGMKSVFFDGTGDYLQCTLADTLGTADWTVEYWVYHNSISGNQIHCAFNGYAPAFYRRNSSNAFAVYHNGGVASPYYNTNITPVAGRWYHMAYCHDDSENKMTVFVDGALADEFAYTGNINGTTFRIGDDGTSAWMNGFISNLRIVKDTVVYSKTFTPATTALKG